MKKRILLPILILILSLAEISAQNHSSEGKSRGRKNQVSQSEMLENCLASVVTVAIFKTKKEKQQLGMRGENNSISESTYSAALHMAGRISTGSGFIIERNGQKYIATNAHVIENASDEPGSIYIYTYDRKKYEVEVVGGDSFYDFALLKFSEKIPGNINTVDFKKFKPRLGDKVFAIGNPLGDYPYTVTDGIISALNRSRDGITGKYGFLQTTATIIWGNSGGPLFDEEGKVAGINSQIAFASAPNGEELWQSQINFALEASIADRLTNDILSNDGRVVRSYLGVEIGEDYVYKYSEDYAYLEKTNEYPLIKSAIPGSPNYDIITKYRGASIFKVNQVDTRNLDEVLGEFEKIKPGNSALLSIALQRDTFEITLTTKDLKTEQLEAIAEYVIEKDPEISANMNRSGVVLKPAQNKEYNQYDFKERTYSKLKLSLKNYTVIAGGLYDYGAANIWQIKDYKDLGAVLKLCGLLGVFDYFYIPDGGMEEDMDVHRYHLSGDPEILQKTLWY